MKNKEILPKFYKDDVYSRVIIFACILFAIHHKHFVFAAFLGVWVVLYCFLSAYAIKRSTKQMHTYFENATAHIEASESMPGFPFPAVSVTENGKITWYNSAMNKLMDGELLFQNDIREYVKDFDFESVDDNGFFSVCHTKIRESVFSVYAHKTPGKEGEPELVLMYFIDVSEYEKLKALQEKNGFVAMTVAFDNFEEVMQGLDDAGRTAVTTSLEKCLTAMAVESNGILKKTERDRYSMIMNTEALSSLCAKKFPVLDAVREISVGNTIAPTLSIGVGVHGEHFLTNETYSRTALDLALGRGGDQVVIKDPRNLTYFGGKTREVEKRTKVKARVVAFALRELIAQSDNILIVGHKNADVDCIGAAMGIVAICRKMQKKAYILHRDFDDTASAVTKKAMEDPLYQDVFIKGAAVEGILTVKTLLLIVDTNSPSYMSASDLLGTTEQIALIDHHRKSGDTIKNPTLVYHEPYASSTCEMVAEMLPYLHQENILLKIEAEALYAGIYMDTKCFTFKTGVRTLEAAAYLRRAGIDPISVKQFFKNNLESYIIKASLIQGARILKDHIAISVTDSVRSPSMIAQAADELLNIAGIDTSFVIAKSETGTIVSGRSTGNINVQVILEKLGGGGHFSVAGAQIKGATPAEVSEEITAILEAYETEV